MVKRIQVLLCLLLLPLSLSGSVMVRVSVDSQGVSEQTPFTAIVEVVMPSDTQVDETSFQIDGQPIVATFLEQRAQSSVRIINGVREESNTLSRIYSIAMQAEEVGVHVIPPISVIVNGERYASQSTTYSVFRPESSEALRLSASVEGILPVFAGQKLLFVYRLSYQQNVDISSRSLPLLDAEGFALVGKRRERQFRQGDSMVWEVIQEVEALKPGAFQFGPSFIEGRFYRQSFFGRRQYTSAPMRATAPVVTVVVKDFPDEGQPAIFSGAVGNYALEARLLSSPDVAVGDKLTLSVTIEGTGPLATVALPSLKRLPEFRNAFRFNDLPDSGQVEGQKKEYILELRPLNANITAIPSLRFAYFDPAKQRYEELQTEPIPISVRQLAPVAPLPTQPQMPSAPPSPEELDRALGQVEIFGPKTTRSTPWVGTYPILLSLLTIVLLGLQEWLQRRRFEQRLAQAARHSAQLLSEAETAQDDPDRLHGLLQRALLERAREQLKLSTPLLSAQELPQDGRYGELRAFLLELEQERYSGAQMRPTAELIAKSKEFFEVL